MKDIYCKIAEWIVSQNIDRAVNSTDIKEIADYVFNTQLKSTGVLKVKECLREKGVTVKDSKIKDEKYIVYLNGEPYYTAKSYDEAMRIESQLYSASDTEDDFQSYYGSYPDVEIRELKDCRFKDALKVKQFRIVEVDKKTKEVIAIHPWIDLTNLTSSNILIIENERNRYRNLSNHPGEISYKVEYQWKDGTPIRDSKFKDSKPTLWGAKAYDVEKECWVGFCKYIDTESGKEASKILENEVPFPYSKYRFLGSYYKLPEHFIKLDDCEFKDSKLKDAKPEDYDLEFIVEFNTHSPIHCDTVKDVEDYIKEGKKLGHKLVKIKIYSSNGSTSVNSLREFKEFIEDYKEQMSLKDSKLTRKQKIWYGEELENLIYPQYLRRNYQKRKTRRRKK